MTQALRFLLFVGLGIVAFIVFILGAEPFEVPGQNPIGERIGVVTARTVVAGRAANGQDGPPISIKRARLDMRNVQPAPSRSRRASA